MGLTMKKHSKRLILITLLAMAVVGYLVYTGVRDTMVYYLTVSEVVQKGPQSSDGALRMGGKVIEGSVVWDSKQLQLQFVVEDEKASLPVVYEGVVPDSFKPGREVIVEGTYTDGTFVATQIMPTCPSKYE